MSQALVPQPVTIAEFEAFTDTQPDITRWELVDGHILAITNPTEMHGQIAANIGIGIRPAAQAQGCRVNFGGLRVQASDDMSDITAAIPDVTVRCGPLLKRNWIIDPVIVVEVLSPSTREYDRGPKLAFYESIASLMDIVLVYGDEIRVEHYTRTAGQWAIEPLTTPAGQLALTGLPVSVPLAEIYTGTGLC